MRCAAAHAAAGLALLAGALGAQSRNQRARDLGIPLEGAPGPLNAITDVAGPVYEATVQATEEAVINAMLAARTLKGARGRVVHALPHDRLRQILWKYGRLAQ